MKRIFYRLLFFCLLLVSFSNVKATDERYAAPALRGNQLATDSTSMVMDTVYFNPGLKPLQTTYFVRNLITFQIDESYRNVIPDEFNVQLKFVVHYVRDDNGTQVPEISDEKTLTIEYSKFTAYGGKSVYVEQGWYKAEVEITEITAINGDLSEFRDALMLTNEILVSREYDFYCTDNSIKNIFTNPATVNTKGELNVYWQPERAADEYDLEWAYIDDLALPIYQIGNGYNIKKIFTNNATRVSITRENYNIPLLYEASGHLFYRVRAVQVKPGGQRVESVWSTDYASGLGSYSFIGLDSSLNWQASTSFAEEGKRKSVVQYFDGSLKSRQTVTKDNTTDTTVIAETFYDHQGRPVIQVMPTPSLSSIIKYTPGLNTLNGAEYRKDEYDGILQDTCNCQVGSPAMDITSGASNYYSPSNPLKTSGYHKYIPDAKGFVFAETQYTPDNTGRISAQGGVGEAFRIGNKHTTNYTYSSADQEELDALFGTEVGNNSHYFKNTVRDANGQVSISYVDMHGRTIATALAGKPPVLVDTLESNKSNLIVKKLLDSNSNVIKGTEIVSSKGLEVTKGGMHRFVYSLLPDNISIETCDKKNICYDCIYDLKITITPDCNDSSKAGQEPIVFTRTNYKLDTNCNTISNFPAVNESVYLYPGSYMVTKTLTVNKKAMDYYLNDVFLVRNTCRSLEKTIQEQQTLMVSKLSCQPAEETTAEETIKQQMLADVTPPYGQYANPNNIDKYSVFWTGLSIRGNYRTVPYPYYDENGVIENPEPRNFNRYDFSAAFKNSWAETLLLIHPEYYKYVTYTNLEQSNAWDKQFGSTETFQEAVNRGYLNPGNFSTHPTGAIFSYNAAYGDPLFTTYVDMGRVNIGYKNAMQASLLNKALDSNNNAISMWSMATILTRCNATDAGCTMQYIPLDNAFNINTDCIGDLDMAWKYFREMYLQKKRDVMAAILRDATVQFPLADLALNHRLIFNDPTLVAPPVLSSDVQTGQDSLQSYIKANCEAYANQWMSELGGCYDSTDLTVIIPQLVQVCKEGGDIDHLMGASTVKPGSANTYKSFEEVLKAYDASRYNSSCNVYLISGPAPYDQQPTYTNKPVFQKPDDCECSTITALYAKYQAAGKDSSFSDYLYRTTGTIMSQHDLDVLRMACNGQINCNNLSAPVYLPPVLQCGVKDVCVDCKKVDSLYKSYSKQFPNAIPQTDGTDSLQQVRNRLFEQFMNTNLGFGKTTFEYLTFMDACKINIGQQSYSSEEDSILVHLKNEFVNDYYNYGRKYDSDGSDTNTIKFDFSGSINNTGFSHKEIIRNGLLQYPDSLITGRPHGFVDMDLIRSRDSACINGYMKMEFRMKDSVAPWETQHGFIVDLSFSNSKKYYISFDHFETHWNYIQATKDGIIAYDLAGFQQNFNGWHTLNFEVVDSLVKFYYDGDLKQTATFPGIFREKFYGFTFEPRSDRNLAPQIDYFKCYDRNGKVFYFEDFNDLTSPSVFEKYIQCPRQPCTTAFTTYYNQQRQANYTGLQIDSIYSAHNILLNICDTTELTLCGKSEPVFAPAPWEQRTPCADSTLFATSTGVLIHEAYRDSLLGSFTDRYLAKCLSARYHENFTLYQEISEYHYTLYYYDQAGNLQKTIPPAGVDVSKLGWARAWSDSVTIARRNKQRLTPNHSLATQYRYNTLNQVMAQQSPDGGLSEFWYDRLGRLAISRNARQLKASATEQNRLYSYTRYDSLGRITEVGQVSNTSANGAMSEVISRNEPLLNNWLAALQNRRGQITNTVYDLPYTGFTGVGDTRQIITQKNLRNRVSYTTITDTGTSNTYNQGTFYTYDILGNVDYLLQDYGYSNTPVTANLMNKQGNRWKKIGYQYDLISGKVNMVMYQPGYRDAFFHRYSYDAENRLVLAETSRDSIVWEKDARYEYYRHGPLARVTLGDQQVQGIDYAYTLQGWLKGINSTGGTDSFDMGGDGHGGSLAQYTARDAMGLTLNYFGNDYSAINGQPFPGYSAFLPAYRPLYNGNISSSSVYQKKFDYDNSPGGPLIFYNYKYDQLNRLIAQDTYNGFLRDQNKWDNMASMGEHAKERIAYDANGNIQKYLRKSIEGGVMDSLNYVYYANSNRLRFVTDNVGANDYDGGPEHRIIDIDGQADSNYVYDAIGNLIADSAEKITGIKWNVYGKIQEITRTATASVPTTNIKYTYDASGNRISQIVTAGGIKHYTWYVRDAQGNILSTYTADGNASDLSTLDLEQADNILYGSSRLGMVTVKEGVSGGPDNTQFYYEDRAFLYERGHKQYELTNHLGNVLATISDRKFGVSSGSSSLISYYEPDIVTAQDYYPFGMMSRVALPNSEVPYKFGFNGKMNDNEVKGGFGLQQDYGMRIYDPRVGRFLSFDPIASEYPWYSPYHFAGNTPVNAKDLDGLEPAYIYPDSKGQLRETPNGDNLARNRIPSGHEQFVRNSFSLNTVTIENQEFTEALNWVPYIGEIKGFAEGISGEEWFTGRQLSAAERKAAFLPVRMKGGAGVLRSEAKQELKNIVKVESAVAKSEAKAGAAHNGNKAIFTNNAIISKEESAWIDNFVQHMPGRNQGIFNEKALSTGALRELSGRLGGVEVAQVFVKTKNGGYYNVFYGTQSSIGLPNFDHGTPYLINHVHPSGNNIPSLSDRNLLIKLQDIQRNNGMPIQSSSQIVPIGNANNKFNTSTPTYGH